MGKFEVGKRYSVEWADCCVVVKFTGVFAGPDPYMVEQCERDGYEQPEPGEYGYAGLWTRVEDLMVEGEPAVVEEKPCEVCGGSRILDPTRSDDDYFYVHNYRESCDTWYDGCNCCWNCYGWGK